jgi:hypothetical protein
VRLPPVVFGAGRGCPAACFCAASSVGSGRRLLLRARCMPLTLAAAQENAPEEVGRPIQVLPVPPQPEPRDLLSTCTLRSSHASCCWPAPRAPCHVSSSPYRNPLSRPERRVVALIYSLPLSPWPRRCRCRHMFQPKSSPPPYRMQVL